MEYPNENMEEFFRKSLDQFNDNPSDELWSALDQRLEEDKPKTIFSRWKKYLLAFSVCLLTFSVIYWQQFNLLKEYRTELTTLSEENEALKQELESANNSILLPSQNASFSENPRDNSNQKTILQNQRDTVYINKFVNTEAKPVWQNNSTSNFESTIPSDIFEDLASSKVEMRLQETKKHKRELLGEAASIAFRKDWNKSLANSLSSNTSKLDYKFELNKALHYKNRKKKTIDNGPVMVLKDDIWGKPDFYYRIGPAMNSLCSLKGEVFSSSSLGLSFGFVQEFGISSRFAIRTELMYTHQEYAIYNNGQPLESDLQLNLPRPRGSSLDILRAEVENKFLELPLGIKYDFYRDKQTSYFINPAVKFSLHRPQQYSYFLSENRIQAYTSDKRFAYLNAVNLAIGIEKSINPALCYQLSIGYDYSIEPTGIERQKINSLYLKANLLFGKK